MQEALRKDVERLYAVLACRLNIIMRPERFETVGALRQAGTAVAILHNMNVREDKNGYLAQRRMAAAHHIYADVAGGAGGLFGAAAQNEAAAGDDQAPNSGAAADGGAATANYQGPIDGAAEDGGAAADAPAGMLPGAVPAMHVHVQGLANADGTLLHSLAARVQALDENEHEMLREDLTENIWVDRRDLLQLICASPSPFAETERPLDPQVSPSAAEEVRLTRVPPVPRPT